jgi:hypothetical protein
MGKVTLYLLLQNFLISSLVPGSWDMKLLAGDADDDQALVLVFFVEGFEGGGILRGKAAFAGHVDEQDDFAAVAASG